MHLLFQHTRPVDSRATIPFAPSECKGKSPPILSFLVRHSPKLFQVKSVRRFVRQFFVAALAVGLHAIVRRLHLPVCMHHRLTALLAALPLYASDTLVHLGACFGAKLLCLRRQFASGLNGELRLGHLQLLELAACDVQLPLRLLALQVAFLHPSGRRAGLLQRNGFRMLAPLPPEGLVPVFLSFEALLEFLGRRLRGRCGVLGCRSRARGGCRLGSAGGCLGAVARQLLARSPGEQPLSRQLCRRAPAFRREFSLEPLTADLRVLHTSLKAAVRFQRRLQRLRLPPRLLRAVRLARPETLCSERDLAVPNLSGLDEPLLKG